VTSRAKASRPLPFDPVAEARRHWVDHGWADAADGMAAVTSIMRAHQIALARVDAVLRPLGLTFARFELLRLLAFSRTGTLPMSVIGGRLQVHPASVTSAVDRLEREGLVARVPHPADRRALLIEISTTGRGLVERATDALNREVFRRPGLPGEDLGLLIGVLTRLRQGAGDF
jgi:DNA-binding MarR family transcriptional regulator